ncbi:unnamed protein product [Phaeothamnion confervicola]
MCISFPNRLLLFSVLLIFRPIFTAGARSTRRTPVGTLEAAAPPLHQWRKAAQPCRFFLWDARSAHSWCACTRLRRAAHRDTLYEGRGGRWFLRIRHADALWQYWPCEQDTPNRCARCGHLFQDHLKAWALASGHRPFEQLLRQIADGDESAGRVVLWPQAFARAAGEAVSRGAAAAVMAVQGRVMLELCGPHATRTAAAFVR